FFFPGDSSGCCASATPASASEQPISKLVSVFISIFRRCTSVIYSSVFCNFPQPHEANAFTRHRSPNKFRAIARIWTQAMPDDVIKVDNGIMRFEGPGRDARNVDLNAEPMKTIVATIAAKKIYSDPTMVAFEGLYVPENG